MSNFKIVPAGFDSRHPLRVAKAQVRAGLYHVAVGSIVKERHGANWSLSPSAVTGGRRRGCAT
jgi:hypothetical protein